MSPPRETNHSVTKKLNPKVRNSKQTDGGHCDEAWTEREQEEQSTASGLRCCCSLNTKLRNTRNTKRQRLRLAGLLVGILVGCLGTVALVLVTRDNKPEQNSQLSTNQALDGRLGVTPQRLFLRMPVYVGVLTMETYLSSRADSCNRTWARDPAFSKVEYFARLRTNNNDRGVVNLTHIDGPDFYHSTASFRMLQYICDHHVEEYDWFVRAVDDSYIKASHLHTFLSTLDKQGEHYLGHPSLGETEEGVAAAEGRYFCIGGPGIILSRRVLKSICPHLKECERNANQAPADVQLGRCVHSVLGLQCRRSSQYRKLFHNSYSRNALRLVEEFVSTDNAISLHPLKTPWLMTTLHRNIAKNTIHKLSKRLSLLRKRENILSDSVIAHNSSRALDMNIEDLLPVQLTVVTSSYKQMNAGTCAPVADMTPGGILQLSEAVRVSNASFQYGDNVQCRHLVDVHYLREFPGGATNYVTKMKCTNATDPSMGVLAKAKLKLPQEALVMRRRRPRQLQSKLVMFLHSYFGDPNLMEFLIMWKKILRSAYSNNYLVTLFLNENQDTSIIEMDAAISDLNRWKRDHRLKLVAYQFNQSVNVRKMHQVAVAEIENNFKNAVVLLAQPNLNFDLIFLTKCRFFVRPGKHMYRPYGEKNVIYRHWEKRGLARDSVTESLWTKHHGPLCIHISDLQMTKKKTKSGRKKKPLKIIKSFDVNLRLDTL